MNCGKYKQWITDRLAGELTPEQDKLLTQHLQKCSSCRKYADEAGKMWQDTKAVFASDGANTEKMTQDRIDNVRHEFNTYMDTELPDDLQLIRFRTQHKRRFIFHVAAACVLCVVIAVVAWSEFGNKGSAQKTVTDAAPAEVLPSPAANKSIGRFRLDGIAPVAEDTAVADAPPIEEISAENEDAVPPAITANTAGFSAAEAPRMKSKSKRAIVANNITAESKKLSVYAFVLPDEMTAPEQELFFYDCRIVISPFVPNTLVGCSVVIPGKKLKGEIRQELVTVEKFAVKQVQISSGNALIFAYAPVAQPPKKKNRIRLTLPNGRKLPFPVMVSNGVLSYDEAPAYLQLACLIHALSDDVSRDAILKDPEARKKVLTAIEALQKHYVKDPARFPIGEKEMLMLKGQ